MKGRIKKAVNFILIVAFLDIGTALAHADLQTNMSADVVIGQPDFTSNTANQGGGVRANTLNTPRSVFTDGERLFIADRGNNRVLIYNSIPTTNNAPADVVIGQSDLTSNGAGTTRTTFTNPQYLFSDGKKLYIVDNGNNRVLIYNSIPTTNNAPADVVIGQSDFISGTANAGGGVGNPGADGLSLPFGISSDGEKLFVADGWNYRVLIYNSIPNTNGVSADVVIGQPDFTTRVPAAARNNFNFAGLAFCDGKRLIIVEGSNRVLIYNEIPTTNYASADIVIGQADFTSSVAHQGGGAASNTMSTPRGAFSDGKRLFIAANHRVLVYNNIPTSNNAPADLVIGQPDFSADNANQNGNVAGNTLNVPIGVFSDGKRLFVADYSNHRVLIYNIGSLPAIDLGPQFEQGKAVLGKVFNDIDEDGWQDKNELGIEGVKVASDTGIYAITDEDGKYHFPYIETGQHLLKIDRSTLPEASALTTESPRKITVTKGILTKVSFGVKLPPELQPQEQTKEGPLLKVSISQDPVLLKPHLEASAEQKEDNIIFAIECNYFLFIEKAILVVYNKDYKKIKEVELSKPLPSKYTLSVQDLPAKQKLFYYQLSVYDKNNKEDRTGIGNFAVK